MSHIYLLRHGKVNGPAALYGKTDIEVSSTIDNEILKTLINHQDKFTQVLTSPLKRCATLAQNFSQQIKKPITIIEDLQEINFGDYDGRAFDDIPYTDPSIANTVGDDLRPWTDLERFWQNPVKYPLPDAEKLNDFYLRIKHAWQALLTKYTDENILLITHGGVIRMILAEVLGLDWKNAKLFSQLQIGNASITHLSSNINPMNSSNDIKVHAIAMPLSGLTADE